MTVFADLGDVVPRAGKAMIPLLAALALSGCTVLTVTASVASAAVGVTTTAVGVAADVTVAAGKGVVKAGGAVYDAATESPAP
jgi:hypothetical protein